MSAVDNVSHIGHLSGNGAIRVGKNPLGLAAAGFSLPPFTVAGTFTTYFQDDELLQQLLGDGWFRRELERDIQASAPKALTAVGRFIGVQ